MKLKNDDFKIVYFFNNRENKFFGTVPKRRFMNSMHEKMRILRELSFSIILYKILTLTKFRILEFFKMQFFQKQFVFQSEHTKFIYLKFDTNIILFHHSTKLMEIIMSKDLNTTGKSDQ